MPDREGFTAFYGRRRAEVHVAVAVALGVATSLPLLQRQMLVLRFVLGYSLPETAAVLDVAEGTVNSGVHRARQQL